MMEGLPLHKHTDQKWALKDKEGEGDLEASRETVVDLRHPSEDMKDDPKEISNDPIDMVAELTNDDRHSMEIELTEVKDDSKDMSDDPLDAVVVLTNDRITAL